MSICIGTWRTCLCSRSSWKMPQQNKTKSIFCFNLDLFPALTHHLAPQMCVPVQWGRQGRSRKKEILGGEQRNCLLALVSAMWADTGSPHQKTWHAFVCRKWCWLISKAAQFTKCWNDSLIFFSFPLRTQPSYMWEPHQGPSCKEAKARCMFFLCTSCPCLVAHINLTISWVSTVVLVAHSLLWTQSPTFLSTCLIKAQVKMATFGHISTIITQQKIFQWCDVGVVRSTRWLLLVK